MKQEMKVEVKTVPKVEKITQANPARKEIVAKESFKSVHYMEIL